LILNKQESFQHQYTDITIQLKPNNVASEIPRESLTISEQTRDANVRALSTPKVANFLLVSMLSLLVSNINIIFTILFHREMEQLFRFLKSLVVLLGHFWGTLQRESSVLIKRCGFFPFRNTSNSKDVIFF
jgi:hypothetical protein